MISDATNTVVANLVLGPALYNMAYDPASGDVLATTGVGAVVYMISDSTNAVVGNLTLGGVYGTGGADGVAYDSGKGELFVSDGSSKVFVVSGSVASSTATEVTSATSTTTSAASSTSLPVSYIVLVLVQIGVILAVARSPLGRKRNKPLTR